MVITSVRKHLTRRLLRARRAPGTPSRFRSVESGSLAMVTLLGVDPGSLCRKVETIEAKLTHFDQLVFVVGSANLAELTREGRRVEQLPGRLETHHQDAQSITAYIERRMDLVLASWQPDVVLEYGLPLVDYARGLCKPEDIEVFF